MLVVIVYCYTRSMQCIGHMYIGNGLPHILRCVLGCIEVVSTLFRSVSLSLRIVCNTVAGHVLLGVLIDMILSAVY